MSELQNFYEQIASHAHAVPQQEVCGLLFFDQKGSLTVKRCANIAEVPEDRFEIPSQDYLVGLKSGVLAAYYHSHWNANESFSDEDTHRATVARLPVICYSTMTRKFNLFRPRETLAPYEGRQFVLGFHDCAALVVDYYEEKFGVKMPYFARDPRMVEDGFTNIRPYLREQKFREVTRPYQNGDILGFSIASQNGQTNHVGIYEDGCLLHQLAGMLSTKTIFNLNWTERMTFAMRFFNTENL